MGRFCNQLLFIFLLAIGSLNAGYSFGQTSKDNFIQGLLHTNRGDDPGAMPFFNKAIELKPDYFEAYMMRGSTYMRLGDHMNAIIDFDKALELDSTMIKAYNYRGFCYLERKDLRRAVRDFSKVIELKPDYPNAFESRGYAKSLMNQHNAALEDYDRSIEMNPSFHEAYHHRAWSKAALKDTTGAITDLLKAIELDEENSLYHKDLGLIYFSDKNYKEAMKYFTKAIKLDPAFGMAYLHRAQLKLEMEKTKPACKDLQSAVDNGVKEATELYNTNCVEEQEGQEGAEQEKDESDK